jgi:hypothetical protein
LDFYIKELKISIEFNGDMWHANPSIYKKYDKPHPFEKEWTSEYIWNRDKNRLDFLLNDTDYVDNVIIIWEKDFKKDGLDKTVENILNQIEKLKKLENG